MKIKKWSFLLILSIVAMMLVACGGEKDNNNASGEKDKVKIIAAHNQTDPDNPYQDGLLKFKEVAEKESNGKIEVEVHAGTIGTEEGELVEKLKLGAADVVLVSPGLMTSAGIKEVDLFALPYLFESYDHWESVVDGEVGEKMAEIINEQSNNDFKLIGYWSAGVRHYYGKKPLETIDDLKGMTIRTQTSGIVADYWKQIGAVPTDIAWGELYQALQQDVVDSAENAYPYYVQQNHHTTKNGKFTTETAHDFTTRFLLMNGKKFDSLSPEIQEVLLSAADASVETEREAIYSQETEYKEKLLEEGGEVNEIDREPFIEIATEVQDKGAEDIGVKDLVEIIRNTK